MQAIVQHRFGTPDVLELSDTPKPAVGLDDVRIRVRAASVGPWVWRFIGPNPRFMRLAGAGVLKPKHRVPGADLAGIVDRVGANVTDFVAGDEVYGEVMGAYAEFALAKPTHIAPKPRNLSFEEAAAVPIAASTALIGLRDKGKLTAGERVLIIGAAGGVGTFAVQLGKLLGAHVTGVCSTEGVDLVRSLGADKVIDYTREDLLTTDERFDVVFQLAGSQSPSELRKVLTPHGTLVLSSGEGDRWYGPIGRILQAMVVSPFVDHKLVAFVAQPNRQNLEYLTELIEAGEIRPVIEQTYPLCAAAEAIRHVEAGRARGKTVITVPRPTAPPRPNHHREPSSV